jgi:hypothetical protein
MSADPKVKWDAIDRIVRFLILEDLTKVQMIDKLRETNQHEFISALTPALHELHEGGWIKRDPVTYVYHLPRARAS